MPGAEYTLNKNTMNKLFSELLNTYGYYVIFNGGILSAFIYGVSKDPKWQILKKLFQALFLVHIA